MNEILHQYDDGEFKCVLYTDGHYTVNGVETGWYMDNTTKKPWLIKKYQQFKSLCKMSIRDGDYTDMKGKR